MRFLLLLFFSILVSSCNNSNNYQTNLERMDEIYGVCDNPMRANDPITGDKGSERYKRCKAKENAQGTSLFDLAGDLNSKILGNNNNEILYVGSSNPFLWRAALDITSQYPLKIADNQGGYIETDWIVDENIEQKRCLMKIQLTSAELLSTSVNTNIVCQNKSSDSWIPDTDSYLEEEKQITLKILSDASILSNSQP